MIELRNTKTGRLVLCHAVWCNTGVANPQRCYVRDKGKMLNSERGGHLILGSIVTKEIRGEKVKCRSLMPKEGWEIIGNIRFA